MSAPKVRCSCVTMLEFKATERQCPRYADGRERCLCMPLTVIDDQRRRCAKHGEDKTKRAAAYPATR